LGKRKVRDSAQQEFNLLSATIGCSSPNLAICLAFEACGPLVLVLGFLPTGIGFVTLPSAIVTLALKRALSASLVCFAVTTIFCLLRKFMCIAPCLLALVAHATKPT
jgi:hypothetical protein